MDIRSAILLVEGMNRWSIADLFRKIDVQTKILPAGTSLFHGTDRPLSEWDPASEEIWTPAWFGADEKVAVQYAKWKRSGDGGTPYYIEYKTTAALKLLDASHGECADLMRDLLSSYTSEEIANDVLSLDFDGWFIDNEEIMIGHDEDVAFVKVHEIPGEGAARMGRKRRGR